MRILYLGNNWLGWQVLCWLIAQGEEVVGLVLHPSTRARYADEMRRIANLPPQSVFDGSQLHSPKVLDAIRALAPDIGLSVLFGYILKPDLLDLFSQEVINLHPSYLPYNRGAYPNVWSIVDHTPAGVTLHYLDAGIDTGDIVAQEQVPVEGVDTGQTLYHKLEAKALALFKKTWPLIRTGQAPRRPQPAGRGTYHQVRDVEPLDHIELDRNYTGRELVDILRARTFPPYPGAYFEEAGRRIYLRLQLLYEEQLGSKL